MLNEARLTCRAMDAHYGPELCRLIGAAIKVLKTRGITFEGEFTYTVKAEEGTELPIVDTWSCTITDDWVKTAILTYTKGHFPGMKDAEKYRAAFEDMLASMMNTTGYTKWEGGGHE